MEGDPDLLRQGPQAVLYAILDAVVDGYAPVVAGLQKDIDEIEAQVFGGDPTVSRRIYELSGEVIEFQRATRPLVRHDRRAHRRLRRSTASTRSCSATCATWPTTPSRSPSGSPASASMLQDILAVNSTLVTQAQNEEMARLTEASIRAERGGQEDLRLGGHPVRPDAGRHASTA